MRITILLLALALSACATPTAQTSWGKAGVSMADYRLDSAQCIIEASGGGPTQTAEASKSGDSNQNSSTTESRGGTNGPGGLSSGGAIVYSGSANPEDANQAAIQQRSQEMQAKRAQKLRAERCLASRGYRQFKLTPEQAAHLAKLPEGSAERRAYLHSIGSDPTVIAAQGL
ncbi:MAG: hypothetical protein K0R61_1125 [Microvirga sp.]|jgi:hypothetical protein|nr:hypothetical protein [Microvirga sp.]